MALLFEANWSFIVVILLLSGGIAFLGDIIGRRIGRHRVSLFKLRPRHTSSLITVLTALLITSGTLLALAVMSDSVRTALFRIKYVQRQVGTLTSELARSTEEHATMKQSLFEARGELADLEKQRGLLEKEIAQMKAGLEQLREGRIIVMAHEIIGQLGLEEGGSSRDIPPALEALCKKGVFTLSQRFPKGSKKKVRISLVEGTLEDVEKNLAAHPGVRNVLRLVVEENSLYGEAVLCRVEVIESRKIYAPMEELVRKIFPPGLERTEVEDQLYGLLLRVNKKAVKDGVLRDPIQGTVGNLDGTKFFEAVDWIVDASGPLTIIVMTGETIYTEGPVKVFLKREEP